MAYVWGTFGIMVTLAVGWLAYAMRDYGKAIAENEDHEAESRGRDLARLIRQRVRDGNKG